MTALAATYSAGSGVAPPRVLLQVTAAPTATVLYASNFAAGVDGWASGSGAPTISAPAAGTSPAALKMLTAAISGSSNYYYATRNVSGLVVGQSYTYSGFLRGGPGSKLTIAISTIGGTGFLTVPTRTAVSYTFTALTTTHQIMVGILAPATSPAVAGEGYFDTLVVKPAGTWLGTTIVRTDDNGTAVVRKPAGGLDTTGTTGSGTMTLTDYEAALTGAVSYTVTDGNGGTAVANLSAPATPGLWIDLPTTSNPATPTAPRFVQPTMVTGFDEASESNGTIHKIIGRADPIGNPGPLATRAGTLKVWCADYAAAVALRKLFADGLTGHLRQPSFAGMDMYFIATRVRIDPEEITQSQRWGASVDYQEVASP